MYCWRVKSAADWATADRLARQCGPQGGTVPTTYRGKPNCAAWLVTLTTHPFTGKPGPAVAFALAYLSATDELVLGSAGVLKAARGRGIQRELIRARVRWGWRRGASRATSYCTADNQPSLTNLMRCGFRVVGYRADALANGDGWVDVQLERRARAR